MKRFAHYLKDNKSNEQPQQCIWFDTESRITLVDKNPYLESDVVWFATHTEIKIEVGMTQYHWLKFGYACYMRRHHDGKWQDEEWLRFETISQFWDFVISKLRRKIKLYLFCHNTSFDLPVVDVFGYLPRHGFDLKSAIIDAPPTILRFRNDVSTIMILDTLNLWRMPLQYLGESIGLPKLEMPDNNDMQISWEQYAKRDTEILKKACLDWFAFLERNDYGSFAPTLASQSMRTYRHRFMRHPIFFDTNEQALKLTREGYYGGRVDCFYIGTFKGTFYALDVNSMYPYCMVRHQLPNKLVSITAYAEIVDITRWLDKYSLCIRAKIRTNIPFVGVRRKGKLIFPIGEFECILSSPEIRYAITNAELLEIQECAVYEQAPLFTEMMQHLYRLKVEAKQANDLVLEFHYKKLMNSFYGKWGQTGKKWRDVDNIPDLSINRWPELDLETNSVRMHRHLGGLHQIFENVEECRESFPAIAAHITAYARMYLWNLIEIAGTYNTYYCDTDCLVVNQSGYDRLATLINEYDLGMLKKVGEYETIQIFGPKDYCFGTKEKHKGVRKDAVWENDHTVIQAAWSGLRGMFASGSTTRPLTKTIRKHLARSYDKGTIVEGGRVLPLSLPDADFVG